MSRPSRALPLLDPKLDVVFRRFFGDPEAQDLLIDFLTAVLEPPSPIVRIDLSPTVFSGATVDEKEVALDLYVVLDNGDRINVEMQSRYEDGFEERITFYWSRSLGSGLSRGQSYSELPRSVFIGILDFVWDPDEGHHAVVRPRTDGGGRIFTDRFEAHLLQLPLLSVLGALDAEPRDGHPSLTDWFCFFRARTDAEREALAKRSEIMQRALDRLERLATDADLRAAAQKHEDDRIIREHFREKAMRKAVAESEARGIAIGERRGRIAVIREMCELLAIPLDETRECALETMSDEALEATRLAIRASRAWPEE